MKSTKHQPPSSREIPSTKLQNQAWLRAEKYWSLKFEVSLELGGWNLDFPQ
jgi:hypothetical protein